MEIKIDQLVKNYTMYMYLEYRHHFNYYIF